MPVDDLAVWLAEQRAAEKAGLTISSLHGKLDKLHNVYETLATQVAAVSYRQDKHAEDLRELRLEYLQRVGGDPDDTERRTLREYRLAELEKETARKKDSILWRTRTRTIWILGIVASLTTAAISGCVTYAVTHLH